MADIVSTSAPTRRHRVVRKVRREPPPPPVPPLARSYRPLAPRPSHTIPSSASSRPPFLAGPRCLRAAQQVRHLRGPQDLPQQRQGGGQVRGRGGREAGGQEGGEAVQDRAEDQEGGVRRASEGSSLQGGAGDSLQGYCGGAYVSCHGAAAHRPAGLLAWPRPHFSE